MRVGGVLIGMLVAFGQPAISAEIKLLAPGALRSTLIEVVPAFERETGHSVNIDYAAAGPLAARVGKGELADAAILSRAEIDRLTKDGIIREGDNPDIAKVGIGVMVRKGEPKPDISTIESVKSALRKAKTISHADPSQGEAGAHIAKMFASWGMDGELKPKIRMLPPGNGLYAEFGKGVAEVGFAPISGIIERKNTLELVGPVPKEMQSYQQFAAGILSASKEPTAAASLIRFLTSAQIEPVMQRNGLEAK